MCSKLKILLSKARSVNTKVLIWAKRLICHPQTPIGAILMLHRIDEPDPEGVWYNQHLKISPNTIKELAMYARCHNCCFVSLDEMADAINKKSRKRRLIAVTLDDGYQDNYLNGSPVFRQLNIPYTIYVCTKMVNGEMLYWWEILEELVLEQNEVVLNDGRSFDCSTKEKKEQSFMDIREIILRLPQNNLKVGVQGLLANYDIDLNYGNDSLGITWEQINELKKDPLATIGNHTYSHCAFTGLADGDIEADIKDAASEMKERTGIEMSHFAFPFGEATAVSRHDVQLVKGLGFKTSATTNDGLICYGTDLLELPRLFVTERNWKQVVDRIVENC